MNQNQPKTFKIEFTEAQLNALYEVIWAAPVPRSVTDRVVQNMENQIQAQEAGEKQPVIRDLGDPELANNGKVKVEETPTRKKR